MYKNGLTLLYCSSITRFYCVNRECSWTNQVTSKWMSIRTLQLTISTPWGTSVARRYWHLVSKVLLTPCEWSRKHGTPTLLFGLVEMAISTNPKPIERDMAQWLERGALQMSLPAVRSRIPLGAGFRRIIMFLQSQSWDIVPWAIYFTLKCFTWLSLKWVPGRTEMAMCTISSMRRNGCRTVCSRGVEIAHKWTGPVTRGWNVKSDDRTSSLILDYKKPAPVS